VATTNAPLPLAEKVRQQRARRSEFMVEMIALVAIVVVVHAFYTAVVRPHARAILAEQAAAMEVDPQYVPERSWWVISKDPEQEVSFILGFWAIFVMVYRGNAALRARRHLDHDYLHLPEGMRVLPEDSREYLRQLETMPERQRGELLPRALHTALERFGATRSVQDASAAARNVCAMENERMDSELSMVRFVAWAIPSIGFVGTVRGIGESLQQAHKAIEGDVSGVTAGLGVSFNSTLIALALSIIVMFFLHQLQLLQERLVLDTENYVDDRLLRHLHVR
jgi:biopolymer transport protein ExbB/TolQ